MRRNILALCDTDEAYIYRLRELLLSRGSFPLTVSCFTEEKAFLEKLKKTEPALILAGESFYRLAETLPDHPPLLLLKETAGESTGKDHIWKYQSGEKIRRQLMEHCAAETTPAPGKGGSKKTELVAVFSPVCRSIQTSFSLLMGQFLAKNGSVLYLNFEPFSGLSQLLKNPGDRDLTDLIYYMEGGKERLVYKLESMVSNVNGLDYISPAFSFVDLGEVQEESWLMLIRTLKEMGSYDHVILDLSEMVHGLLNVLRECDRIYTLADREGLELARMEQYEELMRSLDYGDILERAKRCEIPRFKKLPSGLEELPYSDLAAFVRKVMET